MPAEPMGAERLAEIGEREAYREHLRWAAGQVAKWPAWKQGEIGVSTPDKTASHKGRDISDLLAEVKRLQAVEAELRKDGARLDWLDKNPRYIAHSTGYRNSPDSWCWRGKDLVSTDATDLRAAIDAAMANGGVK